MELMSDQPADTPQPTPDHTATWRDWWYGARPHTWPNALAPVAVGTGAASAVVGRGWVYMSVTENLGPLQWSCPLWVLMLLAFIVSWALIVGVNFANDYSDGIRGTDDVRVGPQRLTGSGLARPSHVKAAAFGAFAVAGVAGCALSILSGFWWLILIGLCCVAAAWFYTGGSRPYGYRGLGEVMVFIFFGLVAVMGTQFTQLGTVTWQGLVCAIATGAFSCANNVVNNLRDIPSDQEAGKITLAVKLGDRRTRLLYTLLTLLPYLLTLVISAAHPLVALALLSGPLAWVAGRPVRTDQTGPALVTSLRLTGKALLLWSLLLTTGFFLSGFWW